jgi:hypothetical protein
MLSHHHAFIEQNRRSLQCLLPERGCPGCIFQNLPHTMHQSDFVTGGEKQAGLSHDLSQGSNVRCDYEPAAEHVFGCN